MIALSTHNAYINPHGSTVLPATGRDSMHIAATKKPGRQTLFLTLTGTAAEIAEARRVHTANTYVSEDGTSATTWANRVEYARLSDLADRMAAQAATPASRQDATQRARRIELLAVAERDGLPHGKSWHCSAQQVERGDAQPWMEGEIVCYVYAD